MINRLKIKFQKGFTLIETLVAVLILVTAIAGPLTIASKGLSTALVAKDQTTAYYLAQDAVEFVRYARDTNRLKGNDWIAGTGSGSTDLVPCEAADGCYLDSLANSPSSPTNCSAGTCPLMNYDSSNHYFNYNAANPVTIFRRTVSITTPVGANAAEASVTVTVSWSDLPGLTHTIIVRENMLNWE